jgi:hypothetical protein
MRVVSVVSAAALLLTACSEDPATRVVAPSSTPATRASVIAIVSGDNQEAKAGETLPKPLVIRITDERGRGVEGVAVSFDVGRLGGLNGKQAPGESRVTIRTSVDGIAEVILEPYALGQISVTARAENTSLPAVAFTARAAGVVVEFRSPDVVGPYAAFWGPCRCADSLNAVTVPVNTPIEWITPDATPYTITSVSGPAEGAAFDSGTLGRSGRFRFVPTVPGTWEYKDKVSGLRATLKAN